MFANESAVLEMNCLDAIQGLLDGTVLICDRLMDGNLVDRWLVHSKYNDELDYLQPNEELRIRRAKLEANQLKAPTPQ
jgi:hypothetical protein